MKTIDIEIKKDSRIKAKGFDISIGRRCDMIALISQSTDEFTSFTAIKKGGRLAKIKRMFRSKLCSTTHFFFEGMSDDDTKKLLTILK